MLKRVEKKDEKGNTIICTIDENGVEQGPFEKHFEDGCIGYGTYKDGKREGSWECYYPDGQLETKMTFQDDRAVGECEYYYPDGQLKSKGNCQHYKEGAWVYYHPNGQLALKAFYDKQSHLREGAWERYYPSGQLQERENYNENGRLDGPYEFYYDNGQLRTKCSFEDGKKQGTREIYYKNGQLAEKAVFVDGELKEVLEAYDHKGKPKEAKFDYHINDDRTETFEESSILKWENWRLQEEGLAEKEVLEKDHVAEIEAIKQRHEAELGRAEVIAGLKGRLEMIADPVFRKPAGPARTPERQAKAEEIIEVRRARTLLRRVAQQAESSGDEKLLKAVARVAQPYADRAKKIQNDFRKKRAERGAKKGRG